MATPHRLPVTKPGREGQPGRSVRTTAPAGGTVKKGPGQRLRLGARSTTQGYHAYRPDVLACPRCGGRMVVLATIGDPAVIHRILTHLGLSTDLGEPAPGRAPPVDGGGRRGG